MKDQRGEMLKDALKLKALAGKSVLFIVNDYPDIAIAAKADGVHLGQEDLPLRAARKLLGNNKIIGDIKSFYLNLIRKCIKCIFRADNKHPENYCRKHCKYF